MSSNAQPETDLLLDGLDRAYSETRQASIDLLAPLAPEDCVVQSIPEVSPTKWHLAHVTWFFERFCLLEHEPSYRAFGLEKVGLLRLFGPNPLVSLWTLARRFREVSNPPSGNVFQMSGTFVIDAGGIVRMAHRSRHPNDHADTARIWACLDALGG